MIQVITTDFSTIHLARVKESTPIFARLEGKLVGLLVKEGKGWLLRLGGSSSMRGCFPTREEAIEEAESYGYSFFIEEA